MKDVYSCIDEDGRYKVQVCTEQKEVIEDIVKIVEPDIIILSLIGVDEYSNELFAYFMSRFPNRKVLCYGNEYDREIFKKHLIGEQYSVLIRPFTNKDILEKIDELLSRDIGEEKSDEQTENKEINEVVGKLKELEEKIESVKNEKENNGRKIKVMLVDDNAIQLRTLRSILAKDYDVLVATSGSDALRIMQRNKPDIVFLDYEMPNMNGKEVFERMMDIEAINDIPVVFLTGEKDREKIMDVAILNPAGYLLKPPDINKVHNTIHDILGY